MDISERRFRFPFRNTNGPVSPLHALGVITACFGTIEPPLAAFSHWASVGSATRQSLAIKPCRIQNSLSHRVKAMASYHIAPVCRVVGQIEGDAPNRADGFFFHFYTAP